MVHNTSVKRPPRARYSERKRSLVRCLARCHLRLAHPLVRLALLLGGVPKRFGPLKGIQKRRVMVGLRLQDSRRCWRWLRQSRKAPAELSWPSSRHRLAGMRKPHHRRTSRAPRTLHAPAPCPDPCLDPASRPAPSCLGSARGGWKCRHAPEGRRAGHIATLLSSQRGEVALSQSLQPACAVQCLVVVGLEVHLAVVMLPSVALLSDVAKHLVHDRWHRTGSLPRLAHPAAAKVCQKSLMYPLA